MTPFIIKNLNETGPNYNHLATSTYQTALIDQGLLDKFERVTGHKPHRLLTRGIFFAYSEFEAILDKYERKEPFYLYTSRAPSGDSLHIGHYITLSFCKYLQDVFDVPLIIQITDYEHMMYRGQEIAADKVTKIAQSNVKDILAFGFNLEKTFAFIDSQYMKNLYINVISV